MSDPPQHPHALDAPEEPEPDVVDERDDDVDELDDVDDVDELDGPEVEEGEEDGPAVDGEEDGPAVDGEEAGESRRDGRRRWPAWLVAGMVVANLGVATVVSPVGLADDDDGDSDEAATSEATDGADDAIGPYLMDTQLFETSDGSWAVGSSVDGVTIPLVEVADDGTGREVGGALTDTPEWTTQGFVGPSVVEDDGTWWLLFASQATDTGRYCLGAASTTDVSAGFEPAATPLKCTDDRDLVDPSVYRGSDGLVLTWAERTAGTTTTTAADGTETTEPDTWKIESAPLDLAAEEVGEASVLLTGDPDGWEAGVTDGPALVEVGDNLVLLYSGNQWGTENYAAGYAVCESASGGCERRSVDAPLEVPLDEAAGELAGVASLQPAVTSGDDLEVTAHGLATTADGQVEPVALRATLSWNDGALVVSTATPIELEES